MARGIAGPFRSDKFTANGLIYGKPTWFGTYTVTNTSGSAATISFYDDNSGGTTNLIEQVIIPNNTSQAIYPNGDTVNGLSIASSNWTNVAAYVRWAPR